jgi:RecA/RadA recombinase
MSTLVERILKNSKIKETAAIRESKVFGKKDMIPTSVPMVNVALSGRIDGGLTPGLLMLAGPSKHFKSAFALMMAASFQKKHPDGVVLFYDSEFGSPESYFESFGIDMDRVVHSPITDIEVLKFDIMAQLDQFDKKDNVMILVDSIGNLASEERG